MEEILGKQCMDGGKCHHKCDRHCFRRACCVPFSDSGLNDDWTPKLTICFEPACAVEPGSDDLGR